MSRRRGFGPPDTEKFYSLKVDNITYKTTVESLKRAFEKYGEIGDVYIPRDRYTQESRGFGFVRYYDERDADDAIDSMDGKMFDGRELRVQLAKHPRPSFGYGGGGGGRFGGGGRRDSYRSSRYSRSRSRSRSHSRRRRSRTRSRSRSRHNRRSRSKDHKRSRSRSDSHHRRRGSSHRDRSRSRDRRDEDHDDDRPENGNEQVIDQLEE